MLTDFMNSIKQKIKKSPLLAFRFAGQTCLPAGRQGQKFNFTPKIGWRARVAGEPNFAFTNWRSRRDSNPRGVLKPLPL